MTHSGPQTQDVSLASDLLELLGRVALAASPPAVRALHLPRAEGCTGKRADFCALELEDGTLGLSYIALGDTRDRLHAGSERVALPGSDPLDLAGACVARDGVARALGFAAANALTRWFFDRAGFVPGASVDSLGGIDPSASDHVGMVGLFGPLVERIVAAGARLTVIELNPEVAGTREAYRVTLDPTELRHCNKVVCTSTTAQNDTLDGILACATAASRFSIIGPGAGFLPDPLFSRGVTRVGGSWVLDGAGVVASLEAGEQWTGFTRKYDIAREGYPGFARLLERF